MLLTRSPLFHPASWASSFDLHVLSTPPAFVLSQDQTLRKKLHVQNQRNKPAMNEFNLTKTNIITDVHIICPKGIAINQTKRLGDGINNWHLTIKCTLLSSQRPDTTREPLPGPPNSNLSKLAHYRCRLRIPTAGPLGFCLAARLRCADKGIHYADPGPTAISAPIPRVSPHDSANFAFRGAGADCAPARPNRPRLAKRRPNWRFPGRATPREGGQGGLLCVLSRKQLRPAPYP